MSRLELPPANNVMATFDFGNGVKLVVPGAKDGLMFGEAMFLRVPNPKCNTDEIEYLLSGDQWRRIAHAIDGYMRLP